MSLTEKIDDVIKELEILKARDVVLNDEYMMHLREIYAISFGLWYGPDNDTCARVGKKLDPHIVALNNKFKFQR